MNKINYIELVGTYLGEPDLIEMLSTFEISKQPRISRGERDVAIGSESHGVELTFTDEHALDVTFREYPEGAIVLSNIFFHGRKTDDYEIFRLDLPLNLSFAMNKNAVITLLGDPQWNNAHGTLLRWDFEKYCVSARFDDKDQLEIVGIQLPNKYTMKK